MEMTTLGEIVSLQRGYDLTETQRHPGMVPVVGSAGVHGYHDMAKAKGPGVTLGRSGASFGKVTYVREDFWPHNTTLFVTDFRGNEPLFIRYLLESLNFSSLNSGSAQQSLNRNYVYGVPVRKFALPLQRRISCILSAYDELIENNTRRVRILEEMAQAIYREWFVHFRFPGYEKVKLVPSPLGPIPHGWEVERVTDAVSVDPTTSVPKEGEKPFVPMSSLSNDSMLVRDIESRTGNSGSKFKNGDTLFARITPCLENGKTAFVQFLPTGEDVAFGSTEFIVLRSKTLSPEFVYLLARTPELRNNAIKSMSGATGRQRVQSACFEKFRFPHPDASTLRVFGQQVAPIFQEVQLIALKNENLRKTRDLLLPKLISGELDVSDLDINVGDSAD
jgi:type I restriction enzyme S subunit